MQPIKIINDNPLDTTPISQGSLQEASSSIKITAVENKQKNATVLYVAIGLAIITIILLITIIVKAHKAKQPVGVFVKPDKKPAKAKA